MWLHRNQKRGEAREEGKSRPACGLLPPGKGVDRPEPARRPTVPCTGIKTYSTIHNTRSLGNRSVFKLHPLRMQREDCRFDEMVKREEGPRWDLGPVSRMRWGSCQPSLLPNQRHSLSRSLSETTTHTASSVLPARVLLKRFIISTSTQLNVQRGKTKSRRLASSFVPQTQILLIQRT